MRDFRQQSQRVEVTCCGLENRNETDIKEERGDRAGQIDILDVILIVFVLRSISLHKKKRILYTVVEGIVSYGCDIWTMDYRESESC
jgi:hypothetical protein